MTTKYTKTQIKTKHKIKVTSSFKQTGHLQQNAANGMSQQRKWLESGSWNSLPNCCCSSTTDKRPVCDLASFRLTDDGVGQFGKVVETFSVLCGTFPSTSVDEALLSPVGLVDAELDASLLFSLLWLADLVADGSRAVLSPLRFRSLVCACDSGPKIRLWLWATFLTGTGRALHVNHTHTHTSVTESDHGSETYSNKHTYAQSCTHTHMYAYTIIPHVYTLSESLSLSLISQFWSWTSNYQYHSLIKCISIIIIFWNVS